MKVSVIDLGFNSLKLVSYEVRESDNSFVAYDRESVPARLGEGLAQTGFLGSEQIARALDGLKFFREINELYGVRHCLPIATSAVREAANKAEFLEEASTKTGFMFKVLSASEEAFLSFTGAAQAIGGNNDVLFFDIGGGSVEFVSAESRKIRKMMSLPLGGLRLSQIYSDSEGMFSAKDYGRLEKRIWDLLPNRKNSALEEKDDVSLVGVGGALRALARWDQGLRNYPFNKLHNYTLKLKSVEEMREKLMSMTLDEIGKIDEIGKARAESIAAGSLVIELIMKKLHFGRLTVSTHGLRDGALSFFLENPLRYHSGRKLSGRELRPRVKKRVKSACKQSAINLLRALDRLDLITDSESNILLHSLRWALDDELSAFRPESFFFQMMDEDTPLSHREQLVAALAVVYLRKQRSAEWFYSSFSSMLKKKNKDQVERLASITRLLEILSRTNSKVSITMRDRDARIRLNVQTQRPDFPNLLFRRSLEDMGEKLDRFVDYAPKQPSSVSSGSSRGPAVSGEANRN